MSTTTFNYGKTPEGNEINLCIDNNLKAALDIAINRVKKKNWDYVCVIAGLPGSGKSTLARTIAKYCCPWFDEKYIAFRDRGDELGFEEITNEAPEYSAVILDESFASLNSRSTMTPEFIRIINHLQIIRQKHLFIILCLPNFFDLAKGIAIFRTSHLFVTYADEIGDRGRFLAFGRDEKRKLFVRGGKYMDYNCVSANFRGRFYMNKYICNDKIYESKKLLHLKGQNDQTEKKSEKNELILKLWEKEGWTNKKIEEFTGLSQKQVWNIVNNYGKSKKTRQKPPKSPET